MSAKEFDLLHLLAATPGKVFPRDAILERVWGWDYEGTTRTVDNFIANLRKKLGLGLRSKVQIQSVAGVGYRMEVKTPKQKPTRH